MVAAATTAMTGAHATEKRLRFCLRGRTHMRHENGMPAPFLARALFWNILISLIKNQHLSPNPLPRYTPECPLQRKKRGRPSVCAVGLFPHARPLSTPALSRLGPTNPLAPSADIRWTRAMRARSGDVHGRQMRTSLRSTGSRWPEPTGVPPGVHSRLHQSMCPRSTDIRWPSPT